ncbi:tRNA (guanosine(37)-N1)-methyltransferase TrmD [Salinisphaera hydrothermalis]|uniref:tRNA (guanine-N(1)-)-methyltransferase n=1 Tax=Salinisphaera hydrothermalis (strain C41B8) TaxID=1304275 RepID=A0A084IH08_SALHC|nr:tRNA (guanosine(37)-N1)-methyltransferase TrmD [Salinisphaera hydrothermalis]KEZ75992.1 tRNA (Guanine37-N1) -methyltransferase [Salinisphaera hydrothermalis C41B8]
MRIDAVTLFPEWLLEIEQYGVVGRGLREQRLSLAAWNPRDYTDHPTRRVDDRPYGGGPGMVMQSAPLVATLDAIAAQRGDNERAPVLLMSPQGARFDQRWAERLAVGPGFIVVCGRYEGIDQRFIDTHVDAEISAGDMVLSGGELPAMMIIDAVARLVSGVLGDDRSAAEDSFANAILDHPHYTRPPSDTVGDVPEVLLSGDHARIERWREKQALGRTWLRRPDLLDEIDLSARQRTLLAEFVAEYGREPQDK